MRYKLTHKPTTQGKIMRKMMRVLPLAITSLLMSQATFAENLDKFGVAKRCYDVAQHLDYLAQNNLDNACSKYALVAAADIKATGRSALNEQYNDALLSSHSADNYLKIIAHAQSSCGQLSSLILQDLVQVIGIERELEILDHPKR